MSISRFFGNMVSGVALIVAVSAAFFPQRALAQDDADLEGPDLLILDDENGVALNGQTIELPLANFSFGEGATAMELAIWYRSGEKGKIYHSLLTGAKRIGRQQDPCSSQDYLITLNGRASLYEWSSNAPYYTVGGNGDFLELIDGGQRLAHTSAGGDITYFNNVSVPTRPCLFIPERTVRSNGLILRYFFENYQSNSPAYRMKAVTTSGGLLVRFVYDGKGSEDVLSRIELINSAVDSCAPLTTSCSFTRQWPALVFEKRGATLFCFQTPTCSVSPTNPALRRIISPDGLWAELSFVSSREINKIEYSGRSPINIAMDGDGEVSSVNNGGLVTSYQYFRLTTSGGGCSNNVVRTNPDGSQETFYLSGPSSLDAGMVCRHVDPLGRITILNPQDIYEDYRYASIIQPEGNGVQYSYDDRANITHVSMTPKAGSGASVISTSAAYPAVCTNRKVCNKPDSVTDARNNATTYTYDPTHGGVLTMTGPAVDGVRPATRYYYTQREAWLRSGTGYAKTGEPIWLKSEERSCRTSVLDQVAGTCSAGAGDLVRTLYDYGPDYGPNNLWLRGMAVIADGQTLRTCYQYDEIGRRISETKPLGTGATCP
jgi:hypothetical protein